MPVISLRMELRHLRYFVAVADALSFRRAADELRVSQPALSKQIKDLEDHLGVILMNRNTGGVSLTDAGMMLLYEARDILERVEMAKKAALDASSGKSGSLTIGSLGAVTASFLPAVLAAYRTRYPRVEVMLHEASIPEQTRALKDGAIQIAFATAQNLDRSPNLASTQVMSSRIVVALGQDHRLAGSSDLSLADLADETFLCVCGPGSQQQHVEVTESILAARGIRHRPVKRVNGFEPLVALASGGHGVSLLLPFASSNKPDHLVFRPIRDEGDDLIISIVAVWWNRSRSKLVQNFISVIQEYASKNPRGQRRDRAKTIPGEAAGKR
jgi:DNA-binding transcriptional LysR family regulator